MTPTAVPSESLILATIDLLWEELDIDAIESMIEGTDQRVGDVLRSIAIGRILDGAA